jgi:hypothetical protein
MSMWPGSPSPLGATFNGSAINFLFFPSTLRRLSGVSRIEARLSYVDGKALLYLAEVLRVQKQELFPTRPPGNRIYDFIEKLETTRF